MTKHQLKTWPEDFAAILDGIKTFDFRLDDRGFAVGDTAVLQEWNPETAKHTGHQIERDITYILSGRFGLPSGYAILGLSTTPKSPPADKLEGINATFMLVDEIEASRAVAADPPLMITGWDMGAGYVVPDKVFVNGITYVPEAEDQIEPLFWYRPVGEDGGYEGPHHTASELGKMFRSQWPDEWKPLYAAPTHPTADIVSVIDDGNNITVHFSEIKSAKAFRDALPVPATPAPLPLVMGREQQTEAMRRLYLKLAEEGGGNWAIDVISDIEAIIGAPQPAPAEQLPGSTNKEMLTNFGAEDIREGSRMVFGSGDDDDTWEDYYEVPFHVLDRIRAALATATESGE